MSASQVVFAAALGMVTLFILGFSVSVILRGTGYRGGSGQWAFLAHRVTGVMVFTFLLLHVVDVSLVRWPGTYDEVHRLYGNVLLRLFEVGLLFSLLFHSFNGLRVVAVDLFGVAAGRQRLLLAAVVGLTLLAGVPGGFVILRPFLAGRFG